MEETKRPARLAVLAATVDSELLALATAAKEMIKVLPPTPSPTRQIAQEVIGMVRYGDIQPGE